MLAGNKNNRKSKYTLVFYYVIYYRNGDILTKL